MVATIEIAPESMSTAQSFSEPSGVTVLYGSDGEMPEIPYAITPMNAPTAILILFMNVCIEKQMPSALSPVFHSRYSTVSPIIA